MPEGAEVKMYATLLQSCIGQSVQFQFYNPRFTKHSKKELFAELSSSTHTVNHVESHGKQLYLIIDNNIAMVMGFGLTGYIIQGNCNDPNKHSIHFTMKINEQNCFYFDDSRHFGTITLLPQNLLYTQLASGFDLMDPSITDEEIITRLAQHRRKNITKVLLDQDIVAGCGNYLKCETLYQCQIDPFSTIGDVLAKLPEIVLMLRRLMHDSYQRQLQGEWIYHNDEKNAFTNWLQVYGKRVTKKGEKVLKEKTPDGRSTYYVKF